MAPFWVNWPLKTAPSPTQWCLLNMWPVKGWWWWGCCDHGNMIQTTCVIHSSLMSQNNWWNPMLCYKWKKVLLASCLLAVILLHVRLKAILVLHKLIAYKRTHSKNKVNNQNELKQEKRYDFFISDFVVSFCVHRWRHFSPSMPFQGQDTTPRICCAYWPWQSGTRDHS